jgi:hypothetical protein
MVAGKARSHHQHLDETVALNSSTIGALAAIKSEKPGAMLS